ncbi:MULTISPECIES: SpoIIE family protein phosphatase [Streptomyces]|uniref:SpoIIE family protein phosphatase n=1 Tax=Streptomyces lycii TaxID=2654337 RepID=A0ABQ7FHJ1_9ACTN|nr:MULTISPECIES: SpoIIE family protein phosphatase [Streptomyces]KAF4407286.1 SpoIIE family protein phosphatase [Streptomyces lycii]PGH50888.1 DNA-binding protein [Streptomyces sp. Ru87]
MAGPGQLSGDGEHRPLVGPELLDAMFYGLDVGVYVVGLDGRIRVVNPRGAELIRRAPEDIVGADAHDLLHRDSDGGVGPREECPLLGALADRQPTRTQETWSERGDGTLMPVGWLMAPYEAAGEYAGGVVTFFDFSGREADSLRREAHLAALENLADRLSLVAEVTTVLTSTLDVQEALRRLNRLVAPRLADWAVVDLLDGEEVLRVSVVHHEGGRHVSKPELEGPIPPLSWASRSPLQRVLRGAPAALVGPENYAGQPDSAIQKVQQDLFRVTGIHSAIMAPLRASHGVLGALTLGRADQPNAFGRDELALVDDIARRAGLAVDNAQLYDRQRRVSETMQRHLLTPLPRVEGLEMAARYQPAPLGSQVGGDWYDAFVLPEEVTMLVIGDVVGHDLEAAAHMSQVRNMLRAFVWDRREPPSVIVDRLDEALVHISDARMASLILGRLEPPDAGEETWRLQWTNAGHPPLLLLGADGSAAFLEDGQGTLLGTDMAPPRSDVLTPLSPRTTIIGYTDGLVESPDEPLDTGLERLRQHTEELAGLPLGDFCDRLIERVRPPGAEDDIALLVVQVP